MLLRGPILGLRHRGVISAHALCLRSRSAFAITEAELRLISSASNIGDRVEGQALVEKHVICPFPGILEHRCRRD